MALADRLPAVLAGSLLDPEKEILKQAESGLEGIELGSEEKIGIASVRKLGDEKRIRGEFLQWLLTTVLTEHVAKARRLFLSGYRISGILSLDSVSLASPIFLYNCAIENDLVLAFGTFSHMRFRCCLTKNIWANNVVVKGSFGFYDESVAEGCVKLHGAAIAGDLYMGGARIENPDAQSFEGQGMDVRGAGLFNRGFVSQGEFNVHGSRFGIDFDCSGGHFTRPDGMSLCGESLTVGGKIAMGRGFTALGEVRLARAKVAGHLECSGGSFSNPKSSLAFVGDGMVIDGGAYFRAPCKVEGQLRLLGATIRGGIECDGAELINPNGASFNADGIATRRGIFLRDGFSSLGTARLVNAKIGGDLDCTGGIFRRPPSGDDKALGADNAEIGGRLFLRNGFSAVGEVRMPGADVSGGVECSGGSFVNPNGSALILEKVHIRDHLVLEGGRFDGRLNLQGASLGFLQDASSSWPKPGMLQIDGCTYAFMGTSSSISVRERLKWLELQPEGPVRPQPYQQLSSAYRAMGESGLARDVLVGLHRAKRRAPGVGAFRRAWSWFLDKSIGYGYRPWLALRIAAVVVMLDWVFFAFFQDCMVPVAPRQGERDVFALGLPDGYPAFSALAYSLDVFIPLVALHQRAFWFPDSGTQWIWFIVWGNTIFGWLLCSLLVAAMSRSAWKD